MARPTGSLSSARLRILSCASDLFYRKGINHVGINEIIDASDVAKMTLYHHFKSKHDIIAAVLDARRAQRLEGIQAAMASARTPRLKVLAAFDYLAKIINDSSFRGCAFINATVELAEPTHPAALISTQHKQRMIDEFEYVAARAGWPNPRLFALQCQLLWDGATAAAQINYDPAPVQAARHAVETLIRAAQSEPMKIRSTDA
ncbi:TetR/AcrR family transcriptional regulator [Pollutimonas harenae]|uniref:TetR/AcrR family transcriptional regulator n=1 Tax=Pollutimonas harenae TaxID=657015 RepID=A0A853GSK2_9BURK|nr:TetR/AcrR family transcriptional regulator [Pollutimonas harenae]NYT85171.1 TetR/AcrR family transcriptional regulator [Pollutimonas harenae]TEA72451.1 TetR/AcrR family transcriptional regulator [Pollutimonas harenae]